jgi:hypothetical protein
MPPEMQPAAGTPGEVTTPHPEFLLVGGRKRRDSNPRYLSARSLSSRRGTVCRSMSQVADLRSFPRSVWLSVGQTAVGCYMAATRRRPGHQPSLVPNRTHGWPVSWSLKDQLGRAWTD